MVLMVMTVGVQSSLCFQTRSGLYPRTLTLYPVASSIGQHFKTNGDLHGMRISLSLTRRNTAVVLFLSFLTVAAELAAQAPPAAKQENGMTASLEFDGSSDSSGTVYELDPSIGYAFGRHFAMGLGVPVYFAQSSATGKSSSAYQLGDPALGLQFQEETCHPRCLTPSSRTRDITVVVQ